MGLLFMRFRLLFTNLETTPLTVSDYAFDAGNNWLNVFIDYDLGTSIKEALKISKSRYYESGRSFFCEITDKSLLGKFEVLTESFKRVCLAVLPDCED